MTVSTRTRIACARLAYLAVTTARGPWRRRLVVVRRGGLRWSLDLREGIDLAIYLLGSFEPSVRRAYRRLVRPGGVVLDIGANIGAHTLPLAACVGSTGRVFAFEATAFAFAKLEANIALNPDLAGRVQAEHAVLVREAASDAPQAIYASWPLTASGDVHPQHRGRLMDVGAAKAWALDDYVAAAGIDRVDFVKLDVDGAEADVLAGGARTLGRDRPPIVMELAPYVFGDTGGFEEVVTLLLGQGYRFHELRTSRLLPEDPAALRRLIPVGASVNIVCLAEPRPQR